MNKNKVEGRGWRGRKALPIWQNLIKGVARRPKKKI
jgi:hypothetical protein